MRLHGGSQAVVIPRSVKELDMGKLCGERQDAATLETLTFEAGSECELIVNEARSDEP